MNWGKKFEPESYFREKRNYATENSHYASPGVTLGFSLACKIYILVNLEKNSQLLSRKREELLFGAKLL
jgi:hypothetical protein